MILNCKELSMNNKIRQAKNASCLNLKSRIQSTDLPFWLVTLLEKMLVFNLVLKSWWKFNLNSLHLIWWIVTRVVIVMWRKGEKKNCVDTVLFVTKHNIYQWLTIQPVIFYNMHQTFHFSYSATDKEKNSRKSWNIIAG